MLSPSRARTALDLKSAIDCAQKYLTPIGYNKTMLDSYADHWYGWGDVKKYTDERVEVLQDAMNTIGECYSGLYKWNEGELPAPFTINITRPGCEWSGEVDAKGDEGLANRLKKWHNNGAVSGYGDMRAQETRVDKNVRDAREIPANEFTVPQGLLDEIAKIWSKEFLPASVRVETYKIHIYGPGGQFKAHKDTPETDLVGTFLVGLGDTTKSGGLIVGNSGLLRATPAKWMAFYPDTAHEVEKVSAGYRAVIAFKIFRAPPAAGVGAPSASASAPSGPDSVWEHTLRAKLTDALQSMPPPFGLLLEHQYCMGTVELNGFDHILHEAAVNNASKKGGSVHLLPVLTNIHSYEDEGALDKDASALVYPLTDAHVDALLALPVSARVADQDVEFPVFRWMGHRPERERAPPLTVDNVDPWLQGLANVPFFSSDIKTNTVEWKLSKQEHVEYTGNESRPGYQDSIYLSYAMVVLPKTVAQTDAKEEQPQDELGKRKRETSE